MTARDKVHAPEAADHPDRLFWYVSGRLEPEEAQQIERHLGGCPNCQAVVRTLESWSSTILRRPEPGAHPGPEDLDALLAGAAPLEPSARRRLQEHLDGCSDCREDLEALRRSYGEPARAASRAAPGIRPVWRWAVAACLLTFVGTAVVWLALAGRGDLPVLMPSVRSVGSGAVLPALAGGGPWRVILVPPSEAPAGPYDLWIERPDGRMVARLEPRELGGREERFVVEVPRLADPGVYRLVLGGPGHGAGALHVYSFRVVPDSIE